MQALKNCEPLLSSSGARGTGLGIRFSGLSPSTGLASTGVGFALVGGGEIGRCVVTGTDEWARSSLPIGTLCLVDREVSRCLVLSALAASHGAFADTLEASLSCGMTGGLAGANVPCSSFRLLGGGDGDIGFPAPNGSYS